MCIADVQARKRVGVSCFSRAGRQNPHCLEKTHIEATNVSYFNFLPSRQWQKMPTSCREMDRCILTRRTNPSLQCFTETPCSFCVRRVSITQTAHNALFPPSEDFFSPYLNKEFILLFKHKHNLIHCGLKQVN